MSENPEHVENSDPLENALPERPKQRILIGSQRNPEAYRPKPLIPVVDPNAPKEPPCEAEPVSASGTAPVQTAPKSKIAVVMGDDEEESPETSYRPLRSDVPESENRDAAVETVPRPAEGSEQENLKEKPLAFSREKVPVPRLRGRMSEDLEETFEEMFADTELESLIAGSDGAGQEVLEPETKLKGTILRLGREHVFVDLGVLNQGIIPLKMFPDEAVPQIGDQLDVIVVRFEDDLYELTMPLAAAEVRDWAQLHEGMIVDAVITKANTGGLECQVNRLRGFIPISQIARFRVEKPEEFVGEKMACIVLECDPFSRNLVLSRRAMLDREREELREKTLSDLEVGQIREGVVRKIIDVGAFVDLGGVDGFIHISTLSWGRVRHPGDVLQEGQPVKVKVLKVDLEKNRISLSYRDDADNPWTNIFTRFQEKSPARGKVGKIMDFGAFVELMPGVEGLVHISEVSHQRIASVGEVLREGDWVDVYIQSIDVSAKRISLSMKQLMPEPKRDEPPEEADNAPAGAFPQQGKGKGKGRKEEQEPVAAPLKIKHPVKKGTLKGGVGPQSDGDKFGLKW